MQEEKLHKESPQVNWVLEFVCHKQSLDKEIFTSNFFPKKYNAWSNRTQVKNYNFEHESDLAG